jgi:U3 small nucleolar RNA-associated protein 13
MKIYQTQPLKLLRVVKTGNSPTISMHVDNSSMIIATGHADGHVKVWDLEGGYATHNFVGHGSLVTCLKSWSNEDKTRWFLASGSEDCSVRVWDLRLQKYCYYR